MELPMEHSGIPFLEHMKSQLELCSGLNWSDCAVSKILIISRMRPVNKQGALTFNRGIEPKKPKNYSADHFGFDPLHSFRSPGSIFV